MVARLSEGPLWWAAEAAALATSRRDEAALAGDEFRNLLLKRAASLAGVRVGERPLPTLSGAPLHLDAQFCRNREQCFIHANAFAVIDPQGALVLRVPPQIADDLIENGLGVQLGRNVLTWPPATAHQFETTWRILLHAYWDATGTPPKARRRLWSEWVVRHRYE